MQPKEINTNKHKKTSKIIFYKKNDVLDQSLRVTGFIKVKVEDEGVKTNLGDGHKIFARNN